jgi:hypothetical protein
MRIASCVVASLLCIPAAAGRPADPHLWLEETDSPHAFAWMRNAAVEEPRAPLEAQHQKALAP